MSFVTQINTEWLTSCSLFFLCVYVGTALTQSHAIAAPAAATSGGQEQLPLAAHLAEAAAIRQVEAGAAASLHRLLVVVLLLMVVVALVLLGAQEGLVDLRIRIVLLLRGAPRAPHAELKLEWRHLRKLPILLVLF